MKKLVAVLCLSAFALAHTPQNLKIVWARTANDGVKLHKEAGQGEEIAKLKKEEKIYITDEKEIDGKLWYRTYVLKPVSKGMKSADEAVASGWIKAEDAWFHDAHEHGFYPLSHWLFNRLLMKVERYVGNYPERSRLIFGREKRAKYSVGKGSGMVTQVLGWDGLDVVYFNSSKRPERASIGYIDARPGKAGNMVSFGPIRLGSSEAEVLALGDELGFEYNFADRSQKYYNKFTTHTQKVGGEEYKVIRVSSAFYFDFYIKDGKVARMVLNHGFGSQSPDDYFKK